MVGGGGGALVARCFVCLGCDAMTCINQSFHSCHSGQTDPHNDQWRSSGVGRVQRVAESTGPEFQAASAVEQSVIISFPPGPQQQTRRVAAE